MAKVNIQKKMDIFTKVIGKMMSEMVTASIPTKIMINTLDYLKIIFDTEKVNIHT